MSLTAPHADMRPRRRRARWRELQAGEMAAPEFLAGRIRTRKVTEIAERAATRIIDLAQPLAVCLDPDGRVTVEAPDEAAEDDIVGVYSADIGLVQLYRDVRDDLAAASTTVNPSA